MNYQPATYKQASVAHSNGQIVEFKYVDESERHWTPVRDLFKNCTEETSNKRPYVYRILSYVGRRVRDLSDLYALAEQRSAIVVYGTSYFQMGTKRRPYQPAAWILHLPGGVLHRWFEGGMYVYLTKKQQYEKEQTQRTST